MPRIDASAELKKIEQLYTMTGQTEFKISARFFNKLVGDFRKKTQLEMFESGYPLSYKNAGIKVFVKDLERDEALATINSKRR